MVLLSHHTGLHCLYTYPVRSLVTGVKVQSMPVENNLSQSRMRFGRSEGFKVVTIICVQYQQGFRICPAKSAPEFDGQTSN